MSVIKVEGEVEIPDNIAPSAGKITLAELPGKSGVKISTSDFKDNVGIVKYDIKLNGSTIASGVAADKKGQLFYEYKKNGLEGELKFTVVAYDANDNDCEKQASITIKAAAPEVQDLIVSGLEVKIATEKNVQFDWNRVAGAASYNIEVRDTDDNLVKTYTSKADYYLVKKMAAGGYSFRVQAIDKNKKAGSWSDPFKFTVADITAPKVGKVTLEALDNNAGLRVRTSKSSDNDGIVQYGVKIGDREIVYQDAVDGELDYTYEEKDFAGKVTVEVTAYDAAKNPSKVAKSTINVKDTTNPSQVTGLGVEDGADEKTAVLTWAPASDNVEDGITYEVTVTDAKNKSKTYKSKTNALTVKKLAAGDATFTVKAFDKAKNPGEQSESFSFSVADITAPKVGKVTLEALDNNAGLRVRTSKSSDNDGIVQYGVKIGDREIVYQDAVDGELIYTYEEKDFAGKVTVEVIAYDAAENESKVAKSTINVKDMTPPSDVTGLTVKAGANAKEAVLNWNAASDNVKDSGNLSYEIWVDGKKKGTSKTPSYTVKNLTAGEHTFEVYAMDKAKNKSDAAVATFSVAAPVVPGKGLNLTVNTGVKITEEDEYPWPFPEAAFVKRIDGTDNADSVTIAGNTLCKIAGIYLGKGNDTVTLQTSSVDGYVIIADDAMTDGEHAPIDMGDGNDTLTCNADTELQAEVINFGAGDDKFIIAQDGDYFASDIGKVNFGAGNDTWEVGVDGDVDFYDAEIDFGEGNDKLYFKEKSYLECWGNLDLDFGAGDDTLVIDKNADVEFDNSNIDFGAGNDSLVLNGTLVLQEPVKGLEKVSGSGRLLISGSDCKKEDFEIFTKAGIEVTNVQGGFDGFTDRKSELADNTKSAARAFDEEDDGYYVAEFWLCGEEYAKTEPFGFADEVDYIKFTKKDEMGDFYWGNGNYEDSGALNVQIFKAGTDELLYDVADPEKKDFTQIANGTACYIKLSVEPDSYAHGVIAICPVS